MEQEKIKIIYEDENLLVVDKPNGWVTTLENNESENNVERYLRENFKNDLPRNGIVHRLDKGTSGVLVTAKNEETLNELKSDFKNRKVSKKYLALLSGEVPEGGEIYLPLGRSRYVFGKFAVREDGKKAWTKFKRIKKYLVNNKHYSLVEIDLKTGRTHQIRVHFAHLKLPLVGDKLYGGDMSLGLTRPFLQSKEIGWKDFVFTSNIANDLKELLDKVENEKL